MRAARLNASGGPSTLRIEKLPKPVPGPGEVLVEVHAVGVNQLERQVMAGAPLGRPVLLPRTVGLDPAGVIAECGPGVPPARLGERVAVKPNVPCGSCASCTAGHEADCPAQYVSGVHRDGGAADYVLVPSAVAFRIGDRVPFPVAAAAVHSVPIALHMIRRAYGPRLGALTSRTAEADLHLTSRPAEADLHLTSRPAEADLHLTSRPADGGSLLVAGPADGGRVWGFEAGTTVVVIGATGALGSAAVQVAAALGARVIAGALKGEPVDALPELGAASVVEYPMDGGDELAAAVRELAPEGVALVLDCTGSGALIGAALRCTAWAGRVVVAAALPESSFTVDTRAFYTRRITLYGCAAADFVDVRDGLALVEAGLVRPVVAATRPLAAICEAFEMTGRRDHLGKVVLSLRESAPWQDRAPHAGAVTEREGA